MVLLIPAAIIIGLLSLGAVLYVGIQCAQITPSLAVIMCVLIIVLFGILVFWSIKKTKRTNKPYYFISVGIMFVIGLLFLAFQNQIVEFYGDLVLPIGPGALPNSKVN